jgi:predicted glycosyltransferase
MNRIAEMPGLKTVLLPRNKNQETQIRANWPQWFKGAKVMVPKGAVDGLNLLWYSDLVVSGGGTMNREAAALGTPVYTTYGGRLGGVDEALIRSGRLRPLTDPRAIQLEKRTDEAAPTKRDPSLLVETILGTVGATHPTETNTPG